MGLEERSGDGYVVCSRYYIRERSCDKCPHQRPHRLGQFDNNQRVARHLRECSRTLHRCICLPLDKQVVRCMEARILNEPIDRDIDKWLKEDT